MQFTKHLLHTLLVFSLLSSPVAFTQTTNSKEIEFVEFDLAGMKEIASVMKKPSFVLVYTLTSSVDYKTMVGNTFLNPEVIQFQNDNFANAVVSAGNKAGMEFVVKYKLTKFPALLYIGLDGELLALDYGAKSPEELISSGSAVLSQFHPDENDNLPVIFAKFIEKQEQYRNGGRKPSFLRQLAYESRTNNEKFDDVVADFLNATDVKSSMHSFENMQFVFDFADKLGSKTFDILLNEKQLYVKSFGQKEVDSRILEAVNTAVQLAAISKDTRALEYALRYVTKGAIPDSREEIVKFRLLYYKIAQDWASYGQIANTYYRTEINPSTDILNTAAQELSLNSNTKEQLEKASLWINKALTMSNSYAQYNETNAIVLYKLGKKKQAMKQVEIAVDKARKTDDNYSRCLELMEIMRADKQILPATK